VFIGFKKGEKGYKIWDPKDKKFILSRDVTFDEASMLKPIISQQAEIGYRSRWIVMLLHRL